MDQEKIGKIIKQIRIDNKLTQKQLADHLGVTYQAVSKWENGKNIPDIVLLKQISNDYNIDINDLLEGTHKINKKNKFKFIIFIIIGLLVMGNIVFIILNGNKKDFEFKTISTTCDHFTISGSIAYNKDKSSIYIANIDYCGEEDNTIYDKINCYLYEEDNNINNKISEYNYDSSITLEEFLKKVTFKINNYRQTCSNYKDNSLYIEINASSENDKIITYKIPLSLEDNCSIS